MRNAVVASFLVATSILSTGCPLAPTCGGFEGSSNRVYERESEMVIFCENGGFVAALADTMIEGRYDEPAYGVFTATRGETGVVAFELADHADGTASAPALGDTMWTKSDLDVVALDHANVLCVDLESRPWWAGQPVTQQMQSE